MGHFGQASDTCVEVSLSVFIVLISGFLSKLTLTKVGHTKLDRLSIVMDLWPEMQVVTCIEIQIW